VLYRLSTKVLTRFWIDFQRDANINALFIAAFTDGRGIAGRQVPGQPLPDHGKQEYDTGFHGGNFARTHEQFYARTSLKKIQAPDHPEFDVLASVLPKAQSRKTVLPNGLALNGPGDRR
jgi:hypothetical protein